jgi:hypothetical protein
VKKLIYVDDISSIGENYFSFLYRKKIITDDPFQCKKKVQVRSFSHYHFDREDLEVMSQLEPKLTPFDGKEGLSKKEFIYHMKMTVYHLIQSGKMNELLSYLYGEHVKDIEIKWAGETPPIFKI